MWSRSTEVSRRKKPEIGELADLAVVGAADARQQARQRVDRGRVARLDRPLGDQHRQGRLAGADVALEPEPATVGDVGVQVVDERADDLHDVARERVARHVGDRRAVEAHALVLGRQHRAHTPGAGLGDAPLATGAGAREIVVVDDPATAVALAERARTWQLLHARVRHRRRPRRPIGGGSAPARPVRSRSAREMLWNDAYLSRKASWTVSIGPLRFLRTISSATPSSFARSASSTSSSPKFL